MIQAGDTVRVNAQTGVIEDLTLKEEISGRAYPALYAGIDS